MMTYNRKKKKKSARLTPDLLTEDQQKQNSVLKKSKLHGSKQSCDSTMRGEMRLSPYGIQTRRANQMWVAEIIRQQFFRQVFRIIKDFFSFMAASMAQQSKTICQRNLHTATVASVLPKLVQTTQGWCPTIHKAKVTVFYLDEQNACFHPHTQQSNLAPCHFTLFLILKQRLAG